MLSRALLDLVTHTLDFRVVAEVAGAGVIVKGRFTANRPNGAP